MPRSLKAGVLHNRNKYLSLPLAHSVYFNEDYNTFETLLAALKWDKYGWEIIRDYKMVAFLMGLQDLCLCHQAGGLDWPQQTEFAVDRNNVKWKPLVDPQKVLMPPLHITLGLMKQFVTGLDKESAAFRYLHNFFPKLSETKVKVRAQIKKILQCKKFPEKLIRKWLKSALLQWFGVSFLSPS